MKKTFLLIASLFFAVGFASAQSVYFAGQANDTAKIWKDNTLIFSLSDTISLHLDDMQVANDSTFYLAGHVSDTTFTQGRVWLNDSCVFAGNPNSVVNRLHLGGDGWTATGYTTQATGYTNAAVWQNGILTHSPNDSINSFAYALAVNGSDIYYAGCVSIDDTLGIDLATVWQNDTLFWQDGYGGCILDLLHDGTDLYAAGYFVLEGLVSAALWQNDSIIFSVGDLEVDAMFSEIAIHNGDIYLAGYIEDNLTVWKNGEILHSHPFVSNSQINALVVNDFGVYYAGLIDGTATVWKDGEILFQPEGCDELNALCVVLPPTYTLTVEADTTGWGTVIGGGLFYEGDTATIAAFPNIGCEFLYWNDSITDNPRDVIILSDSTFTAHFGLIDYLIETFVVPENAGTVTEGGLYHYGDTLTMEAIPNAGFVFVGWNDSITDNPRDVIVLSDSTFTAVFDTLRCTVSTEVTPEGAGTVEGGGVYNYGTTIELTATTNTGYVFDQWSDGVTDNPRDFVVESDTLLIAQFTPQQYEISTEATPEIGGTVEGGGIYDYGTTATLTAIANEYYDFLCWIDGSAANPRTITVTGNATYTAIFHKTGSPEYTLTVVANDPTLGEVTGSGIYPEGTTIEIKATPAFNALFTGWDDGNTDNPRSVIVTQDLTLTALFVLLPSYNIVVESADPEWGTVYGGGLYFINSVITIGATPNEGYHFAGWQDGDMSNPRTVTVTEDATFTASFSESPTSSYTITVYFDEVQGFILGAGTYAEGSTATLAAIPADGYLFVKWSDGVTDNPREIVVTQDLVLAAFFNTTGVDENGLLTFSLYPIPAHDKIHIEGLEGEAEACICNVLGMVVKTATLQGDSDIAIGDLPAGVYMLRIGRSAIRFVKQ